VRPFQGRDGVCGWCTFSRGRWPRLPYQAPFQGALEFGHLRAEGASAASALSGRVSQHIQDLPRSRQQLLRTRHSSDWIQVS
jgi:hypothetical protein